MISRAAGGVSMGLDLIPKPITLLLGIITCIVLLYYVLKYKKNNRTPLIC